MTETLASFLNSGHGDRDTVQQGMRMYLTQRAEFLSPEEMHEQLVAAGGQSAVDAALELLRGDTATLDRLALGFLSCAWEEPNEAERIREAISEARAKAPVIETGILAIVAMYGMYLVVTGGVSKTKHVTKRKADGSIEESDEVNYFSATGPLGAIVSIISGSIRRPEHKDDKK